MGITSAMRRFACSPPSFSGPSARQTPVAASAGTNSAWRCQTPTSATPARSGSGSARRWGISTARPSSPCPWSSASASPPGGRVSTGRPCTSPPTKRCTSTNGAGIRSRRGLAKLRLKLPATERTVLPSGAILDASFFERDTRVVARDLLDKILVRRLDGNVMWGRLVEVEAYLGPDDLAAHSKGGRRTLRTEVMFGMPGHAYVYFTYGMHWCLNFVTRESGVPQAVLVRALEPGPGVGRCGGPGLVTRALGIDGALNGAPLEPPDLYVIDDGAT